MHDHSNLILPEIPYGYCHCGCGQKTKPHPYSNQNLGFRKGDPKKYLYGHTRSAPSGYIPVAGETYVLVPLHSSTFPGLYAKVDANDAEMVSRYRWHPIVIKKPYASGFVPDARGVTRKLKMHQFLLGVTGQDGEVDHINHDGLDNRRANLRVVTPGQNQANKRKYARESTSRFKGVSLAANGKWRAQLSVSRRKMFLGDFESEEDAARAYDAAAVHHFGEFAATNESLRLYQ